MNYIVIDLEWNQSPLGRDSQEKMLPFEIIEIGAIKLNKDREIVGEFQQLIRPQVYQEIHSKTKEIIHMDMAELHDGVSFKEAATKLFQWCGEDYLFCTWGSMDLTELQRNLDYYKITDYISGPITYYDVQKIFSISFEEEKNPRTLSYAIEYLKIESKEDFHRALFDAKYTAEIFKRLDMNLVRKYYSLDYYHNPITKEEEIYLVYDNYSKFISREYSSKEAAFEDREIKDVVCFLCNKKTTKRIRWFTNNSKIYYSLCLCKEHGYLKGKIRVKKSKNGNYFIVKTAKIIGLEAAETLRMKHEEIKSKKRHKNIAHKR